MKTWTTKENKELEIAKMETSHIENCIAMLDRKIEKGFMVMMGGGIDAEDIWYDNYFVQGEEARMKFEPQYTWLKEELDKRLVMC